MTHDPGPNSVVYDGVAAIPLETIHVPRSSLGFLAALVREPLSAVPAQAYTHGMVVTRALGRPRIYLMAPDLVQAAFVGRSEHLSKGYQTNVMRPALGAGLLTAEGADWRRQRRSLAPGFAHARLQGLAPAMIAAACDMRDALLARPNAVVDVGLETTRTTLRIVGDTMLACAGQLDATKVERGLAAFLAPIPWAVALAMIGAPNLPFPGRRRSHGAARELRAEIGRAVAARRAAGGIDEADDLMALLLAARDADSGQAMSDDEIVDNVVTFVTAGHETTSVALTWALRLLADHPETVALMRNEIATVTGDAPLRANHLSQLTFVKQVVNETMRLYPPAPITVRTVDAPFELAGETVAAGSEIVLPIYSIHRHVALWREPERFDPARFAPEAVKARHRYAFMPFGLGPRVCIGNAFALMEATAILAVLVRALDFEPIEPMPVPTARLTLRPKTPVRLRVKACAA